MKKKIHLIMPMGGSGTRFFENGYIVPKPLIEINGHPFFYWATMSLKKHIDFVDITFVVLQNHIDEFEIDKKIRIYFKDAKIVVIQKVLNGALLTCIEGVKEINDDMPLVFNDCDHMFISDQFNEYCNLDEFDLDGGLLTFYSTDSKFSYIKFDETGKIIGTKEKEVVSNRAICGVYYFRNKKVFLESTEVYLKRCEYKEFFVSGVYNIMVSKGLKIKDFNVDKHLSFGTPKEYEEAINDEMFESVR